MIIGLAGKAGSGKDTVGDWMVEQAGFEKVSFAEPIYAALAAMGFPAPATREEKEAKIKGFDFSWRQAAQTLGTEWGRGLDKHLWLKIVESKLRSSNPIVVTDVRFENEALMIRKLGGYIIHIHGRGSFLGERALHTSENGLEVYPEDWTIENSGTLGELYETLSEIF